MAFNPAFGKNAFAAPPVPTPQQQADLTPQQLQDLYARSSATPTETERMTYEDVIVKTAITLVIVAVGGVIGYMLPQLAIPAAIAGFVLALVNIFKRKPSAPLVILYAAVQGVFVGGVSYIVQVAMDTPGIVGQALLGTGLVFGITLALFATGKVRESKTATKVFLIAGSAYVLFSLINFGLQVTGVSPDPWGLNTGVTIAGIPLGLIIGPLVILLAAYSLVMDFSDIKRGVQAGAPRSLAWRAVFGLVLTIVWLYLEILRFLGIARN